MAFIEDFTPFLDQREFAEEAMFLHAGSGTQVAIEVVFDLAYAAMLDELAAGTGPAAHCCVADAPNAARGDELVVRGVTYEIVEPMPDGTGWQTLRLRKV